MSGTKELKKRLDAVKTSCQLTGAMKTVSAANFSRANAAFSTMKPYADTVTSLVDQFGEEFSEIKPADERASICVLICASDRGLCGSYNNELLAFADKTIAELEAEHEVFLCTYGKKATEHFKVREPYVFPSDGKLPEFGKDAVSFFRDGYFSGKFSSVLLIYQEYVNLLMQIPKMRTLLPAAKSNGGSTSDYLFLPDRETVLRDIFDLYLECEVSRVLLEAYTGAQAATLSAMRTAHDNAEEQLESYMLEINRLRQSEVTMSVIETSSGRIFN